MRYVRVWVIRYDQNKNNANKTSAVLERLQPYKFSPEFKPVYMGIGA